MKKIRFEALLISGAVAGLGGAFMSMAYVSMFTKSMVQVVDLLLWLLKLWDTGLRCFPC